jgi:hypothetical protein
VSKRLIYDQAPIKGIPAKWIIAFFISLPFIEYAGIFNPWMFNLLGIAQAIIFFIVFLSMVMIFVVTITFINNNKVVRQITPSWEKYFPDIDLKMILSSGVTPYKDFFSHYSEAVQQNLKKENLYLFLEKSFEQMKNENSDLLEAMNRK